MLNKFNAKINKTDLEFNCKFSHYLQLQPNRNRRILIYKIKIKFIEIRI